MSVTSADPYHELSPLPNHPQLLPQSSLLPCSRICRLGDPSKLPSPLLSARSACRKRGGFPSLAIPACVPPDTRSSPVHLTREGRFLEVDDSLIEGSCSVRGDDGDVSQA